MTVHVNPVRRGGRGFLPDLRAARRIAALALALLVLSSGCARVGGEPFQPTLVRPVPVGEDEGTVGQRLRTAAGQIAGIDVSLATYLTAADPDGQLRATLTDPQTDGVLGVGVLDGEDIRDATWSTIPFDPPVRVPSPVDVTFSWNGITPIALWANAPDPDLVQPPDAVVNDPYRDGTMLLDGRPAEGDLAFRVRGARGLSALPEQLRVVAGSIIRGFADSPVFSALWLLLLLGSTGLAVWGLRRSTARPPSATPSAPADR